MPHYDIFAKYYDAVMTDYSFCLDFIHDTIKHYKPDSKKLLELACGTGNVLCRFSREFETTGVDISGNMLEKARIKIPAARFIQSDITEFETDDKFDIILCMFDSINHMLTFSDWTKLFVKANHFLKPGGLFLFDMNTLDRLEELTRYQPLVKEFDKNLMIMRVLPLGDSFYNFNIRFFEHTESNQYSLSEENIRETAFGLLEIESLLLKLFRSVREYNSTFERIDFKQENLDLTDRVFFCCQK